MSLERVELFDTRSFIIFLLAVSALALVSLSFEYYQYRTLKTFDDAQIEVRVSNHYVKTKNEKTYSVLKLYFQGKTLYTTGSKDLKNLRGRTLLIRIWTKKISFLDYLKGFYIHSVLLHVKPQLANNEKVSRFIASQHKDILLQELFGALFTASPISPQLREKLSVSGASHLLAISGFHLGILSLLLLGVLSFPYRFLQERYFPYRHRHRDLFLITASLLFLYLLFLGSIPSLLRAFMMMLVGYVLYDRHIEVISMQNLGVSVLLLLALWPALLFSFAFWLSVSGVFYIFVFLQYFDTLKKYQLLFLIAIWVYVMMLPISLYFFQVFSLWHPLSIVWSILFMPFYVISLGLHVIGFGGLFDGLLLSMLEDIQGKTVSISLSVLALHVSLSLLAVFSKRALLLSIISAISIAILAIYKVA